MKGKIKVSGTSGGNTIGQGGGFEHVVKFKNIEYKNNKKTN